MNIYKKLIFILFASIVALTACRDNKKPESDITPIVVKGLYSYGPEIKSFIECEEGREYWVADSAKTLELAYRNLAFEKPYTPVYVEVECNLVKSDTATITGNYDSTMVVTKVLKISKQIPEGPCTQ